MRVAGARAAGGPAQAGSIYRVNEQGDEFFQPGQSGRVIPSTAFAPPSPRIGVGSKPHANITIGGSTINVDGNADAKTLAQMQAILEQNNKRMMAEVSGPKLLGRFQDAQMRYG